MIEIVPDKVKVGGINYQVRFKDTVVVNGRDSLGSCSSDMAEIEISNTQSIDRKEETFVHELFHAILNEAGFKNHDEELVERVSKVLYQVLKDNTFDFKAE